MRYREIEKLKGEKFHRLIGVKRSTFSKMGRRYSDKTPRFCVGRKELLKSEMGYEVLVVDATKTPIERSKKAKIALKIIAYTNFYACAYL